MARHLEVVREPREARETALSGERRPPRRRKLHVISGPKPLGAEALALLAELTVINDSAEGLTVTNDSAEGVEQAPPTRPRTRGECRETPRPCPWVSCRHHLYLDVSDDTGSIKINHDSPDLASMPDTCSLDVAERGGAFLAEVGEHLNVTLERARQMERSALHSFAEVAAILIRKRR